MKETVFTEESILAAAKDVFITKGFESARMQDIADYLGVPKSLLNYYYRNKQCLFDSVFEKSFISLMPFVVDVLTGRESMDLKMDIILGKYFEIIEANPYFADLMFNEVKRNPDRFALRLRDNGFDLKKLQDYIDENAKLQNLRYVKAEQLLCNLLSSIIMPFIVSPLIVNMLYRNDKEGYKIFLSERKQSIKELMVAYLRL